jgi:hypothetical protein
MSDDMNKQPVYLFPKWTNKLPLYFTVGSFLFLCFIVFVFWYWFSPKNTDVGYMPKQPIPYSHKLHAGELGIDCRYCHTNVEKAGYANIPSTETCMNCHRVIKTDSPHIQKIKESYDTGKPIPWVKVHRLPDYVYFDHSRHINSGVSCVSCHGRIDKMEVVHQVQPLSMSWCLECHRNPDKNLRPKEFVTKLDWSSPDQLAIGHQIRETKHIRSREDCSTCHR